MIVTMAGAAAAARRTPSGSYSLSLAPTTFTITGRAANLSASGDAVLTLESTSFTTTGVAARTRAARKLVLAPASLTVTGVAAATRRGRKLIASPTTFAMSGAPNSPTRVARKLVLAPAAFSITGSAADLAIATGETDEHWASVVSLINGQESNGSTTFTDSTGRHTWTVANGTPTIQGNMIEFDGASALTSTDNLADFSFDGDFTMEGEIIGVTAGAIDVSVFLNNYNGTSGSWQVYTRGAPNYNAGLYVEGGPAMEPAGTPAATDSLVSWAVTRAGTTTRLFINGTVVAFLTDAGHDWSMTTPGTVCIGKELASNSKYFKGRYRHRITKGVARYIANYTPPTWPLPVGAPSGGGEAVEGDIVDSEGVVVQSAYDDIAFNYAKENKGIPYRFGAPATSSTAPTLPQRADLNSILYGSGARVYYQYGAENESLINDFVTSNGCAIYIPTSTQNVTAAVGRFTPYQIDRRTISQRPQLMWQSPELLPPQVTTSISEGVLSSSDPADLPVVEYRATLPADAGADKLSLVATQGSPTRGARVFTVGTATSPQTGNCILDVGKVPTGITITNGGEFAFVSLWDTVNFKGQVAVITLAGVPANCTWQNVDNWYDWWHDFVDMAHPGFKNKGGWDFMKVIGYIDLPSNMKAPTCIHAYTGMHPYEQVYHDDGLGNPNSITVSNIGKEASPMELNRSRLLDYNDFGKYVCKGGSLIVGSQSEKTVCFIDLKPLFEYFNSMYLDSLANNLETQYYQLNGAGAPSNGLGVDGRNYLNTSNGDVYKKTSGNWAIIGNIGIKTGLGMGANQWPYQLADTPQAMPTIIKTVTMPGRVAGIRSPISYNYWSKDNERRIPDGSYPFWMPDPHYPRAWVVTEEGGGTCHIFSMGRWVPGTKPADITPVASEIAIIGTVTGIGEQITHVAGVKDYDVDHQGVQYYENAGPGALDEMLMVVDRKNRRLNWIQFTVTSGDGGSVVGSLEDSRMDPITADHVDAYYKSNKVVLIADYTGQCVRTYRARTPVPLTYDSDGTGAVAYPTLDVGGEYGGSLSVPGKPFMSSTSNSP